MPITFTHNVYAESLEGEVYWGVYRDNSLTVNGSGYTIGTNNYGKQSSYVPADVTKFIDYKADDHYVTNRNVYVVRDTVDITFTQEGTYTFCETLKLSDAKDKLGSARFTTKACVEVKITKGPPISGESCPGEYYTEGTSHVLSQVRNPRLKSADYAGWKGVVDYSGETDKVNLVFARPDDKINWRNCYYPGAQVNANKQVVFINGDDEGRHAADSGPADTTNGTVALGQGANWKNILYVFTTSPNSQTVSLFGPSDLGVGMSTTKEFTNNHDVKNKKDIGQRYYDNIETQGNTPSSSNVYDGGNHTWTYDHGYWDAYPYPCGTTESPATCWEPYWVKDVREHHHTNNLIYGEYKSEALKSDSYVRIPYNFNMSASIGISGDGGVLFAGETVKVNNVSVKVGTRKNEVVESTYATKVSNARVELITYLSDYDQSGASSYTRANSGAGACRYVSYIQGMCNTVREFSGNLNSDETGDVANINSGKQYNNTIRGKQFSGNYTVYDAKAGDYFCATLAVYPSSSGSDDRQMNASGSDSWLIASPKCIVIAKKPSLQVWGGGAYTVGSVSTSVSQKNSLYPNTSSFSYSGPGGTTVFGSWIEQELIVSGSVTNTASGAGLAKNKNSSAGFGINGGIGSKFCSDLVALTIANNIGGSCGNGAIGHSGVGTTTKNIAALLDYFEQFTNMSSEPSYGRFGYYITKYSETGKSIQYYHITDDDTVLSDTDQSITNGNADITSNTVVVKAENSIRIDHNIYVVGNASTLGQVSQVIIYAAGDIKINCGVDRIDAVLISAGTIDTCYNGGDINSEARSNQLTINGVVIAKKLTLGRTYGNSMGLANGGYILKKGIGAQPDTVRHTVPGSETPAEIINYDASLLLWGEGMASAEESDTFTVTYQHELAPRY